MFFAFCLYGIGVRGRPLDSRYDEWLKEHNHINPLVNIGLVKKEKNGTTRSYLEEDHIELKRYLYLLEKS